MPCTRQTRASWPSWPALRAARGGAPRRGACMLCCFSGAIVPQVPQASVEPSSRRCRRPQSWPRTVTPPPRSPGAGSHTLGRHCTRPRCTPPQTPARKPPESPRQRAAVQQTITQKAVGKPAQPSTQRHHPDIPPSPAHEDITQKARPPTRCCSSRAAARNSSYSITPWCFRSSASSSSCSSASPTCSGARRRVAAQRAQHAQRVAQHAQRAQRAQRAGAEAAGSGHSAARSSRCPAPERPAQRTLPLLAPAGGAAALVQPCRRAGKQPAPQGATAGCPSFGERLHTRRRPHLDFLHHHHRRRRRRRDYRALQ